MSHTDPDQVVNAFVDGQLNRRELIVRLMAMGAAVTGGVSGLAASDSASARARQDGAAPAPEPTFRALSVDHLALNVMDIPRSRAWYVKHLDLRVTRESRSSCFLSCGERDFVALFRNDTPGMHHYSFAIRGYDQEAAAKRLRDAGLTPKPRGGRMYFDDPDGIEVQVSQA